MQLRYYVPFKAQEGVTAEYALKEKLINIEGVAIDSSVNKNKWQVPREDLNYIVETLKGAQLRVDHAESALMVIGKVVDAWLDGDRVLFRAEVGDEKIIEKIIRDYIRYVSIQVDSDEVECSKCRRPTRREGQLVHLCPGAWEVVRKPRVRELSIVASPAYESTEFKPLGFFSAMNDDQWQAVVETLRVRGLLEPVSQSSVNTDDNVGSKAGGLQEPEQKIVEAKSEVKPMSVKADEKASPQQAQVVNVAPGETAPKQVEYEDFMKQLEKLMQQIKGEASDEAIEALEAKVKALEAELAKRAKKSTLAKKLSELSKRLAELEAEKGEEAEEAEEAKVPVPPVSEAEESAKKATGKGIVAVDVVNAQTFGPDMEWFKDLLKAHRELVGFK
ncbi:MAG: hypothetical protein QW175_05260 [Candidatus Bathyarchaeia archaeon]